MSYLHGGCRWQDSWGTRNKSSECQTIPYFTLAMLGISPSIVNFVEVRFFEAQVSLSGEHCLPMVFLYHINYNSYQQNKSSSHCSKSFYIVN